MPRETYSKVTIIGVVKEDDTDYPMYSKTGTLGENDSMKSLIFRFSGYSGLDCVSAILPKMWQTKRIARAWLRTNTVNGVCPDPTRTNMIIEMPWGRFRIVDAFGAVERCKDTDRLAF